MKNGIVDTLQDIRKKILDKRRSCKDKEASGWYFNARDHISKAIECYMKAEDRKDDRSAME